MTILLYVLLSLMADDSFTPLLASESVFESVEIGLAEMSPRGEMGGYAVPASGCSSAGSCDHGIQISQSCFNSDYVASRISFTPETKYNFFDWYLNVNGVSWGIISRAGSAGGSRTVNVPDDRSSSGYIYNNQGLEYDFSFSAINCSAPPTARLWVKDRSGGSWTRSSITIPYDSVGIALQWDSTNATSCTGTNFRVTGSAPSGSRYSIDEPDAGSSLLYTVTCTGPGGSASDSLRVTVEEQSVPPTARLYLRNVTDGGSWTTGNITIDPGDRAQVRWTSSNATTCTGSNFSSGNATSGTAEVSEPSAGSNTLYTVTCTGPGGSDADASRIAVREAIPTATLQVRNVTDSGSWTGSNITIDPIDEVALRWSSTNASSCGGSNFATGGSTSGTQNSVSEPSAGSSRTYTVVCSGSGGSASDALRVTTATGGDPTLEADPLYVRVGEESTLEWNTDTNDPATCSITGPGVNMSSLGSITGTTNATINGESTYILDCPGGDDSVTIQVLPVIQET